MQAEWQKMDTAPTDGRPFLVQFLPYSTPVLCMRKVIKTLTAGGLDIRDCGSWLHVHGIHDDYECGPTSGEPDWAVAPDKMNKVAAWRWREIPEAPQAVLEEIRTDLAD